MDIPAYDPYLYNGFHLEDARDTRTATDILHECVTEINRLREEVDILNYKLARVEGSKRAPNTPSDS
jgi:hypothetical protein